MNKVYIVQDMPRHDYSHAERFGQLVFIGREDLNSRFGILQTPSNREVCYNIIKALRDFRDGDFLLVDGNPVLITLAVNFIAEVLEVNVKLLKWDNRSHCYVETLYPWDTLYKIDKETLL